MLTEKARGALLGLDFRHKKRPQLRSIYILMVRRPDSKKSSIHCILKGKLKLKVKVPPNMPPAFYLNFLNSQGADFFSDKPNY